MNNKISVVLGMKGSGKSSYLKSETRKMERLLIWDYLREYDEGRIVHTIEELIPLLTKNFAGKFRIIFRPSGGNIAEVFDRFSRAAYCMNNMTLVLEEVDKISDPSFMSEGFQELINYGRHKKIDIIAASRRAHCVPRDLTANADVIVSFFQQEPRDVKYITDFMGHEAGERVRTLKIDRSKLQSDVLIWESGEMKIGVIHWPTKVLSFPASNPPENIPKEIPAPADNV